MKSELMMHDSETLTSGGPTASGVETNGPRSRRPAWLSFDNRYLPPAFITLILLVGQLVGGILESYQKTLLAILSAILCEIVLGRLMTGKWPHLASAYIS